MTKDFLFLSSSNPSMEEFNIRKIGLLCIALMLFAQAALSESSDGKDISGEEALQILLEGNSRYVSGNISYNDQNITERRIELIAGQNPFAVVLGCSDSRIPPEIIFDQGLGDIFVVRTAGQVLDNASLGSIEYAVEHLEVPLVVVLGHDCCGAVTATLEGGEAPGHMNCLVESIQPAVDKAIKMGNESDLLNNSIDNNVMKIKEELENTESILSERVQNGELMIVAARYHMDTGVVSIID